MLAFISRYVMRILCYPANRNICCVLMDTAKNYNFQVRYVMLADIYDLLFEYPILSMFLLSSLKLDFNSCFILSLELHYRRYAFNLDIIDCYFNRHENS